MTYQETLHYLFSQLPMYQRVGAAAYKADLGNIIALCEALEHPEKRFKSIHIAGTNGKGSVSHMLASVLQCAGYRTGLHTSPHMKDFRERAKINGEMISKKEVIEFVECNKKLFNKIQPSFFEMSVALAFDYFAKKKVDVAIIETGLGGRLDSTNIIQPMLSVITNISFDHMYLLGNTLKKIAKEKAGIIKKNIPVVVGEFNKQTSDVFLAKAEIARSFMLFADKEWGIKNVREIKGKKVMDVSHKGRLRYKNLICDLIGSYQEKNILTVMASIEMLRELGFNITKHAIYYGMRDIVKNTLFSGRWQILSKKPLTIADCGHNEAGIKEVVNRLKEIKYNQLHMVLGVVSDKDIDGILALLPVEATYYFTKARLPRAMNERELQEKAKKFGLRGSCYLSVKGAITAAKKKAERNDMIFIGGSTFVVAEAI